MNGFVFFCWVLAAQTILIFALSVKIRKLKGSVQLQRETISGWKNEADYYKNKYNLSSEARDRLQRRLKKIGMQKRLEAMKVSAYSDAIAAQDAMDALNKS